jgi:hypothetical protein
VSPLQGRRALAGAWAKISILQYFLAEAAVISAWAGPTPYSRVYNRISDLGALHCGLHEGRAVCSPLHLLMNASFVAQGVGMMLGAVFLTAAMFDVVARNGEGEFRTARAADGGWTAIRPRMGHPAAAGAARILLIVAGAGAAVVGLVPEDSLTPVHYAGAALFFVPGAVALILLWWVWRRRRAVSSLLLAAGVVSLASLAVFLLAPGAAGGFWERMVAYPITLGVALTGITVAATSQRVRLLAATLARAAERDRQDPAGGGRQ